MKMIKNKVRNLLRELYLDILGSGAKPSVGVHLLNSHLLTLEEKLDSSFFDYQLKILSKQSTIIPFGEAVELIEKKKSVKHSLLAFSYDDGFAECYSHIAPVLEKYNGHAGFFINPNFINGDEDYVTSFLRNRVHLPTYKRPMSWQQVTSLNKAGHIIGAHTMDHIRVSEIDNPDELRFQIGACKKEIEYHIGMKCNYFAFTYGLIDRDFDLKSVKVAEEYYKYIFSASNWRRYFSYEGRVFNRRHCEPYWKPNHINYFLSHNIRY